MSAQIAVKVGVAEDSGADNSKYLQAAMDVSGLLAASPPSNILTKDEDIFAIILWRLCIVADTSIINKRLRKAASHCGGIPPSDQLLPAFSDTPMLTDPGNAVYRSVVNRLINKVFESNPQAYAAMPPWGLQMLRQMG